MIKPHFTALLLCISAGLAASLAACSAFDPKNTNPYCGEPIEYHRVQLIDLTGYDMQEDKISAALQSKFGNYRLVTEKSVEVPRDYAYWKSNNIKGIAGAKTEAASWGCNLLVLTGVKAARSGVGVQARNEETVWLVLVGTVSQSP